MVWLRKPPLLYLFSLILMAAMLRVMISSVPPLLNHIQHDLRISQTVAGFTTTVPVLCFGVFAFIAPRIARKIGTNRTLFIAAALMLVGTLIRVFPNLLGLFVGTFLLGVGVAIANVMLIVAIRENYPHQIKTMMSGYTAMINVGAAVGSGLSIPLMMALGMKWNLSLVVWAVPLVLLLAVWIISTRAEDKPQMIGGEQKASYFALLKEPSYLLLTALMAVQSALFYGLLTWIPAQLQAQGVTAQQAGLLLAIFSGLGFLGSFVGPSVVKSNYPRIGIAVMLGIYLGGLFMMQFGLYLPGIVIMGFGQGISFSAGLTLIADIPDAKKVSHVSAVAQGAGYIISAIGPVGLGFLRQISGGWALPFIAETIGISLVLVITVSAITSIERDRRTYLSVNSEA